MIATFVRVTNSEPANQRLYRVDPPVSYGWPHGDTTTDHVLVSAADTYTGPETYMFPADAGGNVLDWMELDGSFRGELDHERALRNAGYEVRG